MGERNVKEIIMDNRAKKGSVHDIMEKRKNSLVQELESSQIERVLAEEEQKKLEAQRRVDALRRGDPTPPQVQPSTPISTTDAKTVLEAVKTGVEVAKVQGNSGPDYKAIAEILKTGVELGKGQAPPPQQNTLEMFKTFHEMYLKPVLDQLASKDKENLELRMRHMESQRVDPLEYLKSIKQASSDLGLSQNTRSEIDMKLEEMRETHDVEMAKLGFETRKWEHQKDSEGRTIEQVKELVKTVTEGPVGKALEALGEAGADKIRGSPKRNTVNKVQVTCPNCQEKFQANDQLAKINCPLCGAELAKATAPAPQPPPAAQSTQAEQKPEGQPQVDGQPSN